jgi:protocatechuate 3,4-dioxygenase beta subunit
LLRSFSSRSSPEGLRAQEVGATLSGTVIDANGGGIPSTNIEVTNQATGIAVKTVSGDNGDYVVPSLAPGTYRLTAEKPGFRTAVLNDITLVVFQRARMDVHMDVGEVSSRIEVEARAPLVDSTTATVAGTVENQPSSISR